MFSCEIRVWRYLRQRGEGLETSRGRKQNRRSAAELAISSANYGRKTHFASEATLKRASIKDEVAPGRVEVAVLTTTETVSALRS